MEQEKQKKRISVKDEGQKFYFDKDGRLVVESNKGVWVDGEKYVKMYGNFSCNAKTMGEIIHKLKGIPVEVGEVKYVNDEDIEHNYFGVISFDDKYVVSRTRCVLGASKERIEEYEKDFAKQEFVSKEIKEYGDKIYELKKSIENFNKLPWWKRMFKKIEVK